MVGWFRYQVGSRFLVYCPGQLGWFKQSQNDYRQFTGEFHEGRFYNGKTFADTWTNGDNFSSEVQVRQTDVAGSASEVATQNITVDTISPTIASIDSDTSDGSYKAGDTINITITTNESVAAGSTITATLDTGETVTLTAASEGTELTGTYTVNAGDTSADLTVNSLDTTGATDVAGNRVATTLPAGNNLADNKDIVIDNIAPTLESWTVNDYPTGQAVFLAGDIIQVTATSGEPLTLGTTTGAKVVIAGRDFVLDKTASEAAGDNTLVFTYTVVAGDTVSVADFYINDGSAITLNGVTDTAGNVFDLSVIDSRVKLSDEPVISTVQELTDSDNPFSNISISYSAPTFADIDGDDDLDLVVGDKYGTLRYYQNDDGVYTERTGAADNPFNDINVGYSSTPAFADIDGDGDLDLVVGEDNGWVNYYQNDDGVYTERTGAADNPFNDINVGYNSTPAFADIDGDGDLDLVVGEYNGWVNYYQNDDGVYTERTGADNPFDDIIGIGSFYSAPTFADIDGDDDLDLVVGDKYGTLRYYQNDDGVYTERTGAADNPFNDINVGYSSTPAFADIDGDGQIELVVGHSGGDIQYYDIEYTSIIDAAAPTVASSDAIVVADSDNGDGVKDNTVTIKFSEPVNVANITLANLQLNGLKTFGNGAAITAIGEHNGFAQSFTITLGSDASVTTGDTITIAQANVVDRAGNQAISNISFNVPDMVAPDAAPSGAIIASDTDGDSAYSENDVMIIKFSELVDISHFTGTSNLVLDANSWGASTITAVDAQTIDGVRYAAEFQITLAADASVTSSNTITIGRSNIVDANGNIAASDVVYNIPDLGVPSAAAVDPIVAADTDGDDITVKDDRLTIKFSEPVAVSDINAANLLVNNGHTLGASPTIAATDATGGFATTFTIDLGADATITTGDTITIASGNVEDVDGTTAAGDVVFVVPDMTPPASASVSSASFHSSLTPTITGGAEDGATVSVSFTFDSVNGDVTYAYETTATDGNWSVDLGVADANGATPTFVDGSSFDYTVRVTDSNGNMSDSISRNLTIDTTAPVYKDSTFNADTRVLTLIFDENIQVLDGVSLTNHIVIKYGDDASTVAIDDIESIALNPDNPTELFITFADTADFTRNFTIDIAADTFSNQTGLALAAQSGIEAVTTAPIITISSLRINQGETITITTDMISASDANTPASELILTVNSVTRGEFRLNGNPTLTFTQQDIVDGSVTFAHDDSPHAPSFNIGVSDDETTVAPAPADEAVFGRIPQTGLIAHWDAQNIDGDGDAANQPTDGAAVSSWVDSSGSQIQHNAGQNETARIATYDADGINGHGALRLDGEDDYYNVPVHEEINRIGPYPKKSLAIVLRTSDDINGIQIIYEQGGSFRGYSFVLSDGHIWAGIWNIEEWDAGHRYKSVDLGEVSANTVYTIAVVQDSTSNNDATNTLKIYLNGQLVSTADHVDEQGGHSGAIGIGSVHSNTINPATDIRYPPTDGVGGHFKGHIGELLLWNHALSDSEISDLSKYTFNKWDITVKPTVDLNGQDREGFTFSDRVVAGDLVNIADTDAYIGDPDTSRYNNVSVSVSGLLDGNSEQLSYNGNSLAMIAGQQGIIELTNGTKLSYSVSGSAGDVVVVWRNQNNGTLTQADVDNLLLGMQYTNSASTAQAGDRIFNVSAEDNGGLVSDAATSTITLSGYVYGTTGVETLRGTSGNDILVGQGGNDMLTGNGGVDTFDYNASSDGNDTITDFTIGNGGDRLDLSDLLDYDTGDTLSDYLTFSDDGSDVEIAIDANGDSSGTDITITLSDIGTGSLDLSDFETYNLIVL